MTCTGTRKATLLGSKYVPDLTLGGPFLSQLDPNSGSCREILPPFWPPAYQKTFRYLWRFYSLLFRAGPEHHSNASSSSTRLLVYACCHHVGVSPGEDTDSEWGLAPKKNSSEDCGLAERDLVLEVSSEDWVEGEWSQLGLARWGGSSYVQSWLFRGPLLSRKTVFRAFFRYFFVVFSWLLRGFFVAHVLGKFYAYSP